MTNIKEIEDGEIIEFLYKKRRKGKITKHCGYFYKADWINKIFGSDFLLSETKIDDWGFQDGYGRGFKFRKVEEVTFRMIKK